MIAEKEDLSIEDFRKFIKSIDWFADFSDMAGVSQRADKEKAKAKELAKLSPEHEQSLRDYSRYIYRGMSSDNNWEECLRPEWDGPDEDIKLWRLAKQSDIVQLLHVIAKTASVITLATADWNFKGKSYWANRPYVSENAKDDVIEYRVAVSDEVFDLMYSIRQDYLALFRLTKGIVELTASDVRRIIQLSGNPTFYKLPEFFNRKYFILGNFKWNMTI